MDTKWVVTGATYDPRVMAERTTTYGAPATATLRDEIRAAQEHDPLAAVTVVVPSNRAGLAARRALGAEVGLANVAFVTPFALAERLGASRAAAAGTRLLTEPILLAAIRMALREDAGFFAPVASHTGTERALARRYAELSRARPETIERIGRAGSPRARALVEIFGRVRELLRDYSDEDATARHAMAAVAKSDAAAAALGTVIVHLPQPMTPALGDLVAAVIVARPSVLIVGLTGDPAADEPVRRAWRALGAEGDGPGPESPPTGTEIITASDADEEIRAVVRRILAVAEAGVPFDRMAVLSPAAEPYARALDAQLAAAGIADNGPAVRILADTMAGRMLERILGLVGAKFARDELVALFASTPVRTPDGRAVPIDRWDRISRRVPAWWTATIGSNASRHTPRTSRREPTIARPRAWEARNGSGGRRPRRGRSRRTWPTSALGSKTSSARPDGPIVPRGRARSCSTSSAAPSTAIAGRQPSRTRSSPSSELSAGVRSWIPSSRIPASRPSRVP